MIPTIGVMVGAYCCLRCLELLLSANSRYRTDANAAVVRFMAVITCVVVSLCMLGLIASGGKNPAIP